jgi:hypothetical protein
MSRDCNQLVLALAIVIGVCPVASGGPPARPKHEQVGEVLGKPVYRDELHPKYPSPTEEEELHRLFLDPVLEKYVAAHRAEIAPTQAELAAVEALLERESKKESKAEPTVTVADIRKSLRRVDEELHKARSEFSREYLEAYKRNMEGMLRGEIPLPKLDAPPPSIAAPSFDDELKEVNTRLAQKDLSILERLSLLFEKRWFENERAHPNRLAAAFLFSNWKFQRRFYDRYGGGRVMYQQAGLEAFDAYRRWIESEEQKGSFRITDPKLRVSFYRYWKRNDGAFLTDPDQLRKLFLEPDWVPRATSR